jgi:hypothetical protein
MDSEFGNAVSFSDSTEAMPDANRNYPNLATIAEEEEAYSRILGGIHYRNSLMTGAPLDADGPRAKKRIQSLGKRPYPSPKNNVTFQTDTPGSISASTAPVRTPLCRWFLLYRDARPPNGAIEDRITVIRDSFKTK